LGLQFKPSKDSELNFSAFYSTLKADNYNSSAYALPFGLVNTAGYLIRDAVISGDVVTSAKIVRPTGSTANVVGLQFDHLESQGFQVNGELISERTINLQGAACNPPFSLPLKDGIAGPQACTYDYMRELELYPKTQKASLFGRGVLDVGGGQGTFLSHVAQPCRGKLCPCMWLHAATCIGILVPSFSQPRGPEQSKEKSMPMLVAACNPIHWHAFPLLFWATWPRQVRA
jgi:hypothetical protein